MRLVRLALGTALLLAFGAGPALAYTTEQGSVAITPSACVTTAGATGTSLTTVTVSGSQLSSGDSVTVTWAAGTGTANSWSPNSFTGSVDQSGQFSAAFTFTATGTYEATVTVGTRVFPTQTTTIADNSQNPDCPQVKGEKFTSSPTPSTSVAGETLPKTGAGNAIPLAIAGGILVLGGGTLVAGQAAVRRRRH